MYHSFFQLKDEPFRLTNDPRFLHLAEPHQAALKVLLETQRGGGTAALFIDEAHLLSTELLEEIRLLGNADTCQEKLLQVILCGQPELLTMMKRRELNALQQRIAARAHLRPLSVAETGDYVAARLQAAGFQGSSPFPPH